MAGWTCPDCKRRFRRATQAHECAPAISLEEYFSTGPRHERPVCEAVLEYVESMGEVHVEPLSVGIFLKKAQTFAQLRPMQKWVSLTFALTRRVDHPTITRKVVPYSGRYYHVFNLRTPDDFDDRIRAWLAESYLDSPD
jgi:hypothetical protein